MSAAFHALLLLEVMTWSVVQSGPTDEPPPLPVRIIDPPARPAVQPPKQQPRQPPAQPPPQVAAKPAEPVRPIEEPPAEAPPPAEQPERKIPLPEQQIVQPSDAGKNEAPPDTRLLSDRDNRVDQQQVKKGNPAPGEQAPGDPVPPKAKAAPPKPKPKPPAQRGGGGQPSRPAPPAQVAKLPGLERLMPDALRMASEGFGQPAEPPGEQFAQADQARRAKPRGADGLMVPSGPIGTLDFLPDVREGDITLLNTKAEVFAPFVRRVAIRVFQNFLISLKREMAGAGVATNETVEAEVVMDQGGDMVGFQVNTRSTRIALASDRRLQQACSDGFFDRNPPPGARAKDGRIHFIFRTAVEYVPTARGGGYYVFLSAGLL